RMASCGEVDHTLNMLPSNKKVNEPCSSTSPALSVPECAICLQTCVHPVRLPCRHIFCYLCVKGASWQSKRCALCQAAGRGNGEYAWYYEGRNGWWQYDERTSRELEDAFSKGKKTTEMLIAGFLYVADLENMVQYRRNEHGRRRKMKRDIADIPKKGVAGLRLDTDSSALAVARENSADGADTTAVQGAASASIRTANSVRPPTSLGGQPTSPSTPSPDASSSIENSFAQMQISHQSSDDRGQNGEGEEVEEDTALSHGSSAPNTSVDESDSESSSEEEEEEGGDDAEEVTGDQLQYVSRTRQRLLPYDRVRESQAERPSPGGESASSSNSVRSRRPDGQCTVTEV
uniref:E3 ubiquitin-protein ligase n=1 Tax=Lepisosteus oculatus TaxID=7918 RepID=W5NID8_LEPOC